jgi:ribonuclease Z
MVPDKLAAFGITGPAIGRLQREDRLVTGDRLVTVEQVSEPRRGQRFAFIMDTRLCDAAFELADGADMVVCESTFADTEAGLARQYGHLTAEQAGRIAAESGARLLVLTHLPSRRPDHPVRFGLSSPRKELMQHAISAAPRAFSRPAPSLSVTASTGETSRSTFLRSGVTGLLD